MDIDLLSLDNVNKNYLCLLQFIIKENSNIT